MPKYRLLTKDELLELEKEFVDYLVINGITADEWVRLKDENADKADAIIGLFSDVVFEGVLRKVEFLEFRARHHVLCYQCLPDKLILIGMTGNVGTDFADPHFIQNALQNPPDDIEVIAAEKPYSVGREEELFLMLNQGHEISDGKLFKALALVLADR